MATLRVRVSPRSSRNRLEVQPGGSIRAWVTAAPTDGQANAAVCELVADALGLAKSRVSVLKGHTAREKTLEVEGLSDDQIGARLGSGPQ